MTVYVHRVYLCLKDRLYRHRCQMILLTFARFIENSTVSKLCRNYLIKTVNERNNSKFDRPTTNFKDERYVEDRRTANSRDELFLCTFFRKRYPKLLAAKFLCKSLRLLSLCYPKFWRPAFSGRTVFPSTTSYLGKFRRSEIVGRLLSFDRRTAEFKDERYIEDRRIARCRDERLILADARMRPLVLSDELLVMNPLVPSARSSCVQFCNDLSVKNFKFDRRTANFRDERRVDAISGRPTLVMSDELLVMSPLVPHARKSPVQFCNDTTIGYSKFDRRTTNFKDERYVEDRRNASTEWRNAFNSKRNAGKKRREVQKRRREVSFFRRGVKKLTRNAIALKLPALSFSLSNFLFCVCLAHARRRGLGTPVAIGVVLKIVPLLQIKRRNAGKKRWEVQKRRRGASFFGRDAKKLGRKAIALKPSALSFSLLNFLFCVCLAHAGQRGVGNPAAAGVALSTDSIKSLQIGDKVPDEFWEYKHLVYDKGDTIRKSLNEYQGKILVLDFWASWCTSCIIRFPEVQALQDSFRSKVHFLLINSMETRDRYANVKRVFDRYSSGLLKNMHLPSLIHDIYLKRLFPHRAVPHYVWIDERGYVVAKTYSTFVNAEQIRMLLQEAKRVESLKKKKP